MGDDPKRPDVRGRARGRRARVSRPVAKQAGIDQMKRSMQRMRTQRIDLMQVHNLLDYKTHLPVLRDWKAAGTIRYLGVTPYSITDTLAEQRLLPVAQETQTG